MLWHAQTCPNKPRITGEYPRLPGSFVVLDITYKVILEYFKPGWMTLKFKWILDYPNVFDQSEGSIVLSKMP